MHFLLAAPPIPMWATGATCVALTASPGEEAGYGPPTGFGMAVVTGSSEPEIAYSEFPDEVNGGEVASVLVSGRSVRGRRRPMGRRP